MRGSNGQGFKAAALVLIMLISTTLTYQAPNETLDLDYEISQSSKSTNSAIDVPVWRVGDRWKYAGTFDPTQLVVDSGVSATVGEIYGDSITEVLSITEENVAGIPTLVYTVRTSANFDKSGVSLDAYTGTAEIVFLFPLFLDLDVGEN